MSTRFVTSEFSKELGGAAKTLSLFRRALGGEVVSFNREPPTCHLTTGEVYFRTGGGPIGRRFGTPAERELGLPEWTEREQFLSCHLLFRFHCDWVRKRSRELQIPYWVVPHGGLDPWVFSYRSFQKRLWMQFSGRPLFRDAAMLIFATASEREKASRSIDVGRSVVINWPVELIDLTDRDSVRTTFRQRFGLPVDCRIILFLGRLHSMKRPQKTIELFARSNPPPDCVLCLVGNEDDVTIDQLRSFVPPSLSRQVCFIGPMWGNQRDEALVASDAFVSLSHRENFGHTTAEAMSAGLPVLLSPGVDLAGEFGDLDPGVLLSTWTDDEAIEAFHWFYELDSQRAIEIAERNRRWVMQNLDFTTFRDKLRALQDSILGDGPMDAPR